MRIEKKLEQQESCRMKNTERNYPIFFLARKIKTARAPGTPISDKGAFFVGEVSGWEGIGWLPRTDPGTGTVG